MSASTVGRKQVIDEFISRLHKCQESVELVVKILREGILGVATLNMRIHFVVFICLDNGQEHH